MTEAENRNQSGPTSNQRLRTAGNLVRCQAATQQHKQLIARRAVTVEGEQWLSSSTSARQCSTQHAIAYACKWFEEHGHGCMKGIRHIPPGCGGFAPGSARCTAPENITLMSAPGRYHDGVLLARLLFS